MSKQCEGRVLGATRIRQCYLAAVTEEDGKHWCTRHAPSYLEKKEQARRRKEDAKLAWARVLHSELHYDRLAGVACRAAGLSADALADGTLVKEMAETLGTNDPSYHTSDRLHAVLARIRRAE